MFVKLAFRESGMLSLKYIFYGVFRETDKTRKQIYILKEIWKIHTCIANKENNLIYLCIV